MATEYKLSLTASEIDRKLTSIGDINTLETEDKSSLVNAINEIVNSPIFDTESTPSGGGSITLTDPTLTLEGSPADAKATGDRLGAIEYQTVTTDVAYEHKDLPEGEKSVAVQGGGVFGDKVYLFESVDLIPRKALKISKPNGIVDGGVTITRNDYTYHIEGTSTCKQEIFFAESSSDVNVPIDESLIGKTVRAVSFINEIKAGAFYFNIAFYDVNGNVLTTTNHYNQSTNALAISVGQSALTHTGTAVVPENTAYMRIMLQIRAANLEFNHDVQLYIAVDEGTQTGTLSDGIIGFTDITAPDIITAPYSSVVNIYTPLVDYIGYQVDNAKGDKSTFLTPEAFGAIGDGYADDSNAINLCIAKAIETKQTVFMAQKYLLSETIDIGVDGLNFIINDIVYSGTDTAIRIHGCKNTFKIHSITSSARGISFEGGEESKRVYHNNIEINSLVTKSHGITFTTNPINIYQNNIRFDSIKAGGAGCYGIAYFFDREDGKYVAENNFYGGQIAYCEWAVYRLRGNSKCYNFQIEENVQGGFLLEDQVVIFHPRSSEAQRDGSLPFYKLLYTTGTYIYGSDMGISISEIDLSEASEFGFYDGERKLGESHYGIIYDRIFTRQPNGLDVEVSVAYTNKAYVWGRHLIMTPHMNYRKVVTTATLDTRLIGRPEETIDEIKSLSQLPTKFVVDNVNTEIYLHASYCAFGFNEFEVEQANSFACKIYDVNGTLVFDGTEQGDGIYKFNVYKDADLANDSYSYGTMRLDDMCQLWNIKKIITEDDIPTIAEQAVSLIDTSLLSTLGSGVIK